MAEGPLKAEYFVTRPDGTMIPLVAMDELPHHITVAGVSRIMSSIDIVGMTGVGCAEFRHRHHSVQKVSEPAAVHRSGQTEKVLRARHFLTRNSGNMVPLLAMDEMPDTFVIEGVPQHVSVFDLAGMTCVGTTARRSATHVVEDNKNIPLSFFIEKISARNGPNESKTAACNSGENGITMPEAGLPNHVSHQSRPALPTPVSTPLSTSPESDTKHWAADLQLTETNAANGIAPQISSLPETASVYSSPTLNQEAPSVTELVPGTKKYCSYWLRHGECDYQQQGCLYKHEMPLNQETLKQLGLRDIPRWYREKHLLGSFLAAGGSGAAFGGPGLKSSVASGIRDDDKRLTMMPDRQPSGERECHPLAPVQGRTRPNFSSNNNNNNNKSGRRMTQSTPPGSLSLLRSSFASSSLPPPIRKLRSNETRQQRQQFDTLQALAIHRQLEQNRKKTYSTAEATTGDEADVEDDASDLHSRHGFARPGNVSPPLSDIEAVIGREDAQRKAKEAADYAQMCRAKRQAITGEDDKTPRVEAKPKNNGNQQRGPGRRGQGGKSANANKAGRSKKGGAGSEAEGTT